MQLHGSYHAMISGGHLRPNITAIMQRIVTLGCQLTERSFNQIIIYRKFAITQISEELIPKTTQIIKRLLIIGTSEIRVLLLWLISQIPLPYFYPLFPKRP